MAGCREQEERTAEQAGQWVGPDYAQPHGMLRIGVFILGSIGGLRILVLPLDPTKIN